MVYKIGNLDMIWLGMSVGVSIVRMRSIRVSSSPYWSMNRALEIGLNFSSMPSH